MREINNFFKIVFLIFFSLTAKAESKILSIGNPNAKEENSEECLLYIIHVRALQT